MIILGSIEEGRPQLRVVLMMPAREGDWRPLQLTFLIDTGADRTLVPARHYVDQGWQYSDFRAFPMSQPVGIGGEVEVRVVPAKLFLQSDDGELHQLEVLVEMAKPHADLDPLPPLLGRDVTDLFRVVIDRQAGLVALTESKPQL